MNAPKFVLKCDNPERAKDLWRTINGAAREIDHLMADKIHNTTDPTIRAQQKRSARQGDFWWAIMEPTP